MKPKRTKFVAKVAYAYLHGWRDGNPVLWAGDIGKATAMQFDSEAVANVAIDKVFENGDFTSPKGGITRADCAVEKVRLAWCEKYVAQFPTLAAKIQKEKEGAAA